MPWASEHKQNTRASIVSSAAKLFTTYGFDHVGINEIMGNAGLTRGAFYSHFKSKSELYAESILLAGEQARESLLEQVPSGCSQQYAAAELVRNYLSRQHSSGESARCPLAYLATDISERDDAVRTTYTQAFKNFVENMKLKDSSSNQQEMLRRAVLMIGGLAIARALNDDELVDELFSACQYGVIGDTD